MLVVLVFAAAAIGYYKVNATFGLSESPQLGYEEVLDPSARAILVVQSAKALPFLKELLPTEAQALPAWLPFTPQDLLDRGAFREAAVVMGSDLGNNRLNFTLFVNEKIGGPFLVQSGITKGAEWFRGGTPLKWNDPPLELPRRGALQGKAHLPVSPEVLQALQSIWPQRKSQVDLPITREHLVELYLDNTDGDLAAFIAAGMDSSGGSGAEALRHPMVAQTLPAILQLRIAADITGPDQITIQIAITSTPEKANGFPLFFNMGIPQLQKEAARQGLKLEMPKKPAVNGNVITADLQLSGFRERLETSIATALGAQPKRLPEDPALPATAEPAPAG